MKQCFKCGETKPLAAFYPHKRMADGHLNKCKECTKKDVTRAYYSDREKRQAYLKRWAATPEGKAKIAEHARRRAQRDAEKYRARSALRRAVKRGLIERKPCEVCGSADRIEAHHTDYSRPLDVVWLCFEHHRAVHGQTPIVSHS